jgi:hypothetical protein
MVKFRRKPVEIDAWLWDGKAAVDACPDWIRVGVYQITTERELVVPTLAGVRYAAPGDWIIRDAMGEIYPCKPHIFEATYEAVQE